MSTWGLFQECKIFLTSYNQGILFTILTNKVEKTSDHHIICIKTFYNMVDR